MPLFQYRATSENGETISGTAAGVDIESVSRELKTRGLSITDMSIVDTSIQETISVASEKSRESKQGYPPPPTTPRSTFETRIAGPVISLVSLKDLQFFFRQLGTLLNAGINPTDALETLSRNSGSPKLSAILREAKDHTLVGRPISTGFERYPEVFNPLMLSMIKVGEDGGFLPEQCLQLSDYIERDIELRNMIKRETASPKLTMIVSVFIIIGTNILIQSLAPGGMGLPVPWIFWALILIVGGTSFFFVKFLLPQPEIRAKFDEFNLKIPGIGGMIQGFAMAKFGRSFGALYKGGIPVHKALELAADSCGNEAIKRKVSPAIQQLKDGAGITDTFQATGAFSPLVLDMTRTGEMTGNMDQMLIKMAEFYEDEGATKAQMSAKIIGVACLIVTGIYVLIILLGFYGGMAAQAANAAGML